MRTRNIELTVLKALGIIAVVSCHMGVNVFNIMGLPISLTDELFPEYSYNIPLFIFASGYFYKKVYESDIIGLAIKRVPSLVKYAKCNMFYFLLCLVLINVGLLHRDVEFNIRSLLIEPFLGGFQFYFNGPGWFVPFLFLLQILFTLLRKICGFCFNSFRDGFEVDIKQESIFLLLLIVVGFISTYVSNLYPVVDDNVYIFHSFLRILFGLQFFQLGFYYKEFIEERIRLSLNTFLVLVFSKVVFHSIFGYYTFSLRTLKFNNSVVFPFVVSVLGLLYCLHLVKFILNVSNRVSDRVLSVMCIIGDNTWGIMMHHLLVKWSLSKLYALNCVSDSVSVIGNYLISPILCLLLPIVFSYLCGCLTKNKQCI